MAYITRYVPIILWIRAGPQPRTGAFIRPSRGWAANASLSVYGVPTVGRTSLCAAARHGDAGLLSWTSSDDTSTFQYRQWELRRGILPLCGVTRRLEYLADQARRTVAFQQHLPAKI